MHVSRKATGSRRLRVGGKTGSCSLGTLSFNLPLSALFRTFLQGDDESGNRGLLPQRVLCCFVGIPGFDKGAFKCYMHRVVEVVENASEFIVGSNRVPCSLDHGTVDSLP
jgi:hypothetical protein